MSTAIDHAVQARLVATTPQSREIPASLRYDRADPFAVRLVFPPAASLDGAEVTWMFGRDLLAEGLRLPSGTGDVRIWPCGPETVVVEFHSVDGMAMVQFGTRDLRDFPNRSYGVIAKGGEGAFMDVEASLAGVLRSA
ncbi:spore wall synthesis regulator SsgD [Streptomyces halobius]|uniref:SsgA family sporulation/cell division regulator n=1 Tax=Streptomyces halobius TaxID=2879846 RepID=A0ABY4M269_9ACTN|nr:SsgA family sporulation/cell division regulator [Streptomyces halobius]UQA91851.1 SsgA family sporulation/cell division regulator [Streptomyces halobius]